MTRVAEFHKEHSWQLQIFNNMDRYFKKKNTLLTDINELDVPVTVHREQSMKREKTNKMQKLDVYY